LLPKKSIPVCLGGDVMMLNMSDTDLELLARYTRSHAENACTEVVRRHLDLVYSAVLRQVRPRNWPRRLTNPP
jgi:hypothetical protein